MTKRPDCTASPRLDGYDVLTVCISAFSLIATRSETASSLLYGIRVLESFLNMP